CMKKQLFRKCSLARIYVGDDSNCFLHTCTSISFLDYITFILVIKGGEKEDMSEAWNNVTEVYSPEVSITSSKSLITPQDCAITLPNSRKIPQVCSISPL